MRYLNETHGKEGISAKVVAASTSADGHTIVTWELEYPRFIHSEFMTHRVFSRNAASSRAIPTAKLISMVEERPAMPVHWGKNQPGMQANEQLSGVTGYMVKSFWKQASKAAIYFARRMEKYGAHKQIVNRLLEPYQFIKVVITATELDNFFLLRDHKDAQPEIEELAKCMKTSLEGVTPRQIFTGEWHVPYVESERVENEMKYWVDEEGERRYLSVAEALKVSSSCCAQVSYRVLNQSVEKALDIHQKLVESEPVHASPFEHQATPMAIDNVKKEGFHDQPLLSAITHADIKTGVAWSANFKGFIQYRKLFDSRYSNR